MNYLLRLLTKLTFVLISRADFPGKQRSSRIAYPRMARISTDILAILPPILMAILFNILHKICVQKRYVTPKSVEKWLQNPLLYIFISNFKNFFFQKGCLDLKHCMYICWDAWTLNSTGWSNSKCNL